MSRDARMKAALAATLKSCIEKEAAGWAVPVGIGLGVGAAGLGTLALGGLLASDVAARKATEHLQGSKLENESIGARMGRKQEIEQLAGDEILANEQTMWDLQPDGSYKHRVTNEQLGGDQLAAKIGSLRTHLTNRQQQLQRERMNKIREAQPHIDPVTGSWVAGKRDRSVANAATFDRDVFEQKYLQDRSGVAQLFGSPFIHNGSLYFGDKNFWRYLTGKRNAENAPDRDQIVDAAYRQGQRTFTGAPLWR